MESRRVFSEEFKREAVRLAEERGNIAQTARELGISDTVIQRWKKQLQKQKANGSLNPFPGHGNPKDQELARVTRENRKLMEENEVLKKAVGIFTNRQR